MRRRTLLGVAVAAGAIGLLALLPPSDAARIREILHRAARDLGASNDAEVRERLAATFTADAVIRAPDWPPLGPGPAALERAVRDFRARHQRVELTLSEISVTRHESGDAALAQADAVLTWVSRDRLDQDARQLTAKLVKSSAGWRIAAVDIAAETSPEPEARP